MLLSGRSFLPPYQFKRSLTCYLTALLLLLSALSTCLIIVYGINIINQQNVMFLTVANRQPEEKQPLLLLYDRNESQSQRAHVLSTPQQLRDWHTSTSSQYSDLTRDRSRQQTLPNRQRSQPDLESQQRQQRIDLAEIGQSAIRTNGTRESQTRQTSGAQWQATGFNAELSDSLSLQREVPDTRHRSCKRKHYPADLPTCSIIIVYYRELNSVLLRTLHSIFNRTPEELLHEIILVDDFSQSQTSEELNQYISENFGESVRHLHLGQREGLIRARLAGARKAQGEVLVFLDAHVEVNVNWLPPLLAPIEEDPYTCTTPIIDVIKYDTFHYQGSKPSRGGFNWEFNYVQLPLLRAEKAVNPEPHNNPIMNGGLFAIGKDFFFKLGGYDKGLEIWGAEQFELSFKIWQCGGRLLEVPCSRVGHLYRSAEFHIKYTERKDDFISRNYKRVAEVWMDEYKEFLYEHVPKLNQIDAGDLTEQKLLRRRLKCKPFKWFMKHIAHDLLKVYPPIEPPDYASGAIRSLAIPRMCLDLTHIKPMQKLQNVLKSCSPDIRYPYASQSWQYGFRKDLRYQGNCLETQSWSARAPIWLWPCHNGGGNQHWKYDRTTQMLIQEPNKFTQRCLEVDVKSLEIFLNFCDFVKKEQKWQFGWINKKAMDRISGNF